MATKYDEFVNPEFNILRWELRQSSESQLNRYSGRLTLDHAPQFFDALFDPDTNGALMPVWLPFSDGSAAWYCEGRLVGVEHASDKELTVHFVTDCAMYTRAKEIATP